MARDAEPQASYAGPRDPTEELLCEVWGELLGVEGIGINDDVFDLGAHSLTVMWAAARILDRTGLDLPSRWFYEEPTVAGLARLITGTPSRGSIHGAR
jgi:Phosphopantetheine attachment site